VIKWIKKGECILITVSGEFDLCMVPEFRDTVDNLIVSNPSVRKLILNLKNVSFIDSSGLGAIMGRYKKMVSKGGILEIESPSHNATKALLSCGLDKIIDIYENTDVKSKRSSLGVV